MTFDAHAYLDAASAAVDVPIPADARDGVAANLARLHALAAEVMAFDLTQANEASTDSDA